MADESQKDFYANAPDAALSVRTDGEGNKQVVYDDMTAEGMEKLTLPGPPWEQARGRTTEDVLSKNFSRHIITRIERAFEMGHFADATPSQTLGWYRGVLEGAELADKRTLVHLDKLQDGLAKADDQQKYFEQEIRPFLESLRPGKR